MRERVISVGAVVSYYFQDRESPLEVKCKWAAGMGMEVCRVDLRGFLCKNSSALIC